MNTVKMNPTEMDTASLIAHVADLEYAAQNAEDNERHAVASKLRAQIREINKKIEALKGK